MEDAEVLMEHGIEPWVFEVKARHRVAERLRKGEDENTAWVRPLLTAAHARIEEKRATVEAKRRTWKAGTNKGIMARLQDMPDEEVVEVRGVTLHILAQRRRKGAVRIVCWGGTDAKLVEESTERDVVAGFPLPTVAFVSLTVEEGTVGDVPGLYLARFDNHTTERGMGHRVFCCLLRYFPQEERLLGTDVMSLEAHGHVVGPPRVVTGSYLSREQELMLQAYQYFGGESEKVNLVAYYSKLGFQILRPWEFLLDIVGEDGVYMYGSVQNLERVCRRRFWTPVVP